MKHHYAADVYGDIRCLHDAQRSADWKSCLHPKTLLVAIRLHNLTHTMPHAWQTLRTFPASGSVYVSAFGVAENDIPFPRNNLGAWAWCCRAVARVRKSRTCVYIPYSICMRCCGKQTHTCDVLRIITGIMWGKFIYEIRFTTLGQRQPNKIQSIAHTTHMQHTRFVRAL